MQDGREMVMHPPKGKDLDGCGEEGEVTMCCNPMITKSHLFTCLIATWQSSFSSLSLEDDK